MSYCSFAYSTLLLADILFLFYWKFYITGSFSKSSSNFNSTSWQYGDWSNGLYQYSGYWSETTISRGQKRCNNMVEMKGVSDFSCVLILKYARDFLPRFCACSGAFQKNDELITWDEEFAAQHIKWSKQNPSYWSKDMFQMKTEKWVISKSIIELTSVDLDGNVTDKFKEVFDGLVHIFISRGQISILCCMYYLYVFVTWASMKLYVFHIILILNHWKYQVWIPSQFK